VTVTNGLFTTTLDFGSGVFDGTDRWLEIAVRTNGNPTFFTLYSRQKLNPTPYAVRAGNFSGAIQDAQLSTNVALLNASQTFSGNVRFSSVGNTFSGSFTGNGVGLTNYFLPESGPPLLTRPAMGIANWIDYWNVGLGQEPGEDVATNAILKMATNGLVAGGRDWLRIDFGWAGGHPDGTLSVNSNKFPHGMPWLVQFAHARNVKVDLAISWPLNASLDQLPGDIRTMMGWGVDGICLL